MQVWLRTGMALALAAVMAGCGNYSELRDERRLGAFELGFNVVIADNAQTVPGARVATEEQWESALTAEIERRFGRYDGGRLYHIGISVDGYLLAPPGVPVLLSPKSTLVITVNVFDDALGENLVPGGKQFTVVESLSGESVVGSGFTMSADEQLLNLAQNAAGQIENWLEDNPDWFDYPVVEGNPFEEGMTFEVDVTEIAPGTGTATRPTSRPGGV